MQLEYLRESLHYYLTVAAEKMAAAEEASSVGAGENSSLLTLAFNARQVIFKPRIMGKYRADSLS